MLSLNATCNSTLDDMRIGGSEIAIVGDLTFHDLGLIIAPSCTGVAILISLYLIWMHALHYTKPYEQRHIIRILFMVPVYATSAYLQFRFYWHAIYFQVISDCYEAFAIASFFALLCHYIAPDLHEQKEYFRTIQPKGWVWPLSWMKKCCGGQRGCWRTPRSGLTWFNIIWVGIYQYCFIRVALTITAVVTQYFGRYCESSNSPVFAHIWILVIVATAVTIAMYCVIQFYVQLREDLAPHSPFLKVLAIKLVIFLCFWQIFIISILTSSTFGVLHAIPEIAYPDLKVGIPALLLCVEMAIFAVLHLFAFPWHPYRPGTKPSAYPLPSSGMASLGPHQGGFLGHKALINAMNPMDLVRGFARSMRWLFVGRKHRENDPSYKTNNQDMSLEATRREPVHLPIAEEFRRSRFGLPNLIDTPSKSEFGEGAGLIAHAQPNPLHAGGSGYVPARHRYDANGQDVSSGGTHYEGVYERPGSPDSQAEVHPALRRQGNFPNDIGMAIGDPVPYQSQVVHNSPLQESQSQAHAEQSRVSIQQFHKPTPSQQWARSSQPINGSEPSGTNPAWEQRKRDPDDDRV